MPYLQVKIYTEHKTQYYHQVKGELSQMDKFGLKDILCGPDKANTSFLKNIFTFCSLTRTSSQLGSHLEIEISIRRKSGGCLIKAT